MSRPWKLLLLTLPASLFACDPPEPEPAFCGGIAGIPCEAGLVCVDDPDDDCDPNAGGADCGGICVEEPAPTQCGGIAGLQCPEGQSCVDNPSDDCDPTVGADCGGICVDEPQGEACGARLGDTCDEDEFCSFTPEAICGFADATGVCAPRPEACIQIYDPVCGCDGQTYGNACTAASNGVSVQYEGECQDGGGETQACGGLLGLQCDEGEFCSYPPEAICGAADATGVCATRPEACIQIYDPVCGCDDQTYGNACTAASNGVSVAYEGECNGGETQACGGLLGLQCDDGEYCRYELGDICGAADATGTCTDIPDVCTDIYAPVCGCDGETYGNECYAALAGTGISSEGECAPPPPPFCGGFAGFPCPEGLECIDDPNDDCDPNAGGADCGGICVEPGKGKTGD